MNVTATEDERATEQMNFKFTPAQVKAMDALRYSLSPPLTRVQLVEAALSEYSEARGHNYPTTARRAA